jgi:hypothetical protein
MEDGPFALIARLRRLAGDGVLGQMLDCFYCLSMWSAALIAFPLAKSALHYFYLCLALSAGAILLESLAHRHGNPEPVYYEEPIGGPLGNSNVVLRQIEIRDAKDGGLSHAHGFGD